MLCSDGDAQAALLELPPRVAWAEELVGGGLGVFWGLAS